MSKASTSGRTSERARARMVERHLVRRGIHDAGVLHAMRTLPREDFVPADKRHRAYDDVALPIEAGQTISQPYIVALMLQLAAIKLGDRVLEVGAGSGYGAGVISMLVPRVLAMERHPALVRAAAENLSRAGIRNAEVIEGDGTRGLPERGPFDVIIVSAGGDLPEALKTQLAPGGRLVIPLGAAGCQRLVRITRRAASDFHEADFGPVSFVPLVADGLPEDE